MALGKPNIPSSIWLVVAGLAAISVLGLFGGGAGGVDAIPYSQFQQYLDAGKVKQVTVAGNVIRGTLTDPMPDGRSSFTTVQVPPDLAGQLAKHKVEFTGTPTDAGALDEGISPHARTYAAKSAAQGCFDSSGPRRAIIGLARRRSEAAGPIAGPERIIG